ncbi:hypothetical protein [Proteus mirabilis]|uniref:hypothetical protein n=1 Tax=Proteus mirabilis TaxID=584 RepID=UPI0034D63BD6
MIKNICVVPYLLDPTIYLPISREDFQFSSRSHGKEYRDVSSTDKSQVILLSSYQSLTLEGYINELMESILRISIFSDRANKTKENYPCFYLLTDNRKGIDLKGISETLKNSNVEFKPSETSDHATLCRMILEVYGIKFSFAPTPTAEKPKYAMYIDGKKVVSSYFIVDPFSNTITHEYAFKDDWKEINSERFEHNLFSDYVKKLLMRIIYLIGSFQRLYRNQMSGKINIISPPTALGRGNVWGTYNGR